MTILILFHSSSFRNLKHFYLFVRTHMQKDFPHTASYNRFVELQQKVCIPLAIFLRTKSLGQCTGISFIDSTPIQSCHIKREKQHKIFKEFARKGKSTLGWFYGFKLHLIINDKGELLGFSSDSGQCRRQRPLETHGFPQTDLREALRRQGLYLERPLRTALH